MRGLEFNVRQSDLTAPSRNDELEFKLRQSDFTDPSRVLSP